MSTELEIWREEAELAGHEDAHPAARKTVALMKARVAMRMASKSVAPSPSDAECLNWLEMMANQRGGILLHDGSEGGRLGLGLRPGSMKRTLRQAIATAMSSESRHG